jgi:hypothetical protein
MVCHGAMVLSPICGPTMVGRAAKAAKNVPSFSPEKALTFKPAFLS